MNGEVINEGDVLSIDGTSGAVYLGLAYKAAQLMLGAHADQGEAHRRTVTTAGRTAFFSGTTR